MVTPIPNNENRNYIIVDPNRSDIGIPVQILNPTSSDIILNSKTVIGVMQEVDEEKPFNLSGADPEILKGGCTKFSGPELPYSGFDPFFNSLVVASL